MKHLGEIPLAGNIVRRCERADVKGAPSNFLFEIARTFPLLSVFLNFSLVMAGGQQVILSSPKTSGQCCTW